LQDNPVQKDNRTYRHRPYHPTRGARTLALDLSCHEDLERKRRILVLPASGPQPIFGPAIEDGNAIPVPRVCALSAGADGDFGAAVTNLGSPSHQVQAS